MEIRDKSSMTNLPAYVKQIRNDQPNTGKRDGTRVGTGSEGDNVHLSPAARQIHEAKKTLATLADVDEAKVERIRNQIQDGTYRMDAARVAIKMMEEAFLAAGAADDAGD